MHAITQPFLHLHTYTLYSSPSLLPTLTPLPFVRDATNITANGASSVTPTDTLARVSRDNNNDNNNDNNKRRGRRTNKRTNELPSLSKVSE